MAKATLEVPEVCGKTIRCLSINDDQTYGREVNLKLTDGTEVSIWVTVQQNASVECIESESGKVVFERKDQEVPRPEITL